MQTCQRHNYLVPCRLQTHLCPLLWPEGGPGLVILCGSISHPRPAGREVQGTGQPSCITHAPSSGLSPQQLCSPGPCTVFLASATWRPRWGSTEGSTYWKKRRQQATLSQLPRVHRPDTVSLWLPSWWAPCPQQPGSSRPWQGQGGRHGRFNPAYSLWMHFLLGSLCASEKPHKIHRGDPT